jgi:hypothetical protein
MLTRRHNSQFQDGFAIFALSVTVFAILATAMLLALQVSSMNVDENGYGVRTASISSTQEPH